VKEIAAYLTFGGTCRDAMEFYKSCLGGDLQMMPFSKAPIKVPDGAENLIVHARLATGSAVLMASDSMPGMPVHPGNNFWVALQCESAEETDKLFEAFSDRAKIVMPVRETFWATRFGMLTDKFGVNWMFNFGKAPA
jgi:PhnB protein